MTARLVLTLGDIALSAATAALFVANLVLHLQMRRLSLGLAQQREAFAADRRRRFTPATASLATQFDADVRDLSDVTFGRRQAQPPPKPH